MNRSAFVLALVGAASVVALRPSPARACGAYCFGPRIAPAESASIPASAPGFVVRPVETDGSVLELRDANGVAVAGSIETDPLSQFEIFKPASPLAPGQYTTHVTKWCSGDEMLDTPVTVTEAVALPTAAGSLSVKNTAREVLRLSDSSGGCTEDVDVAYVDLDVAVDPSLAPYLPLVVWDTRLDGQSWSGKWPLAVMSQMTGTARSYVRIFTRCDGQTPPSQDKGATAGHHDVEVRALLPGAAAIAPMTIGIDLSCDAPIGGGGGNSSSGGGGSNGGAASGADSSSDGCTAVPHRAPTSSTSLAGFFLGVVALAAVRLRRRRNTLD